MIRLNSKLLSQVKFASSSRSLCSTTLQSSILVRNKSLFINTAPIISQGFVRTFGSVAESKASKVADHQADIPHFSQAHKNKDVASGIDDDKLDVQSHQRKHSAHTLPHPIWNLAEIEVIEQTHVKPNGIVDWLSYGTVRSLRLIFDVLSGYLFGIRDERAWLRRVMFLETVAGVPGMVGGMWRHLTSLRKMERDGGWIHTLLEEAENERMHLMIALTLRKPNAALRGAVLGTQMFFFCFYTLAYAISPRYCHRFVGYLEEEAVRTYTGLLKEIDEESLPLFSKLPAPFLARDYYQLKENASVRDLFACIRADETHHRDVNHTFASMNSVGKNPFPPGH